MVFNHKVHREHEGIFVRGMGFRGRDWGSSRGGEFLTTKFTKRHKGLGMGENFAGVLD